MGQEQDFANNGSETLAKNRDEECVPDGDTLRHHIRKFWIHELRELNDELSTVMYESADEMGSCSTTDSTWQSMKSHGGSMAIPTPMEWVTLITRVERHMRTNYSTICIVGDDGERFTLDWTIVTGREETREVIGELVDTASNWCDIKNIFLDRGFYGVLMIKALQATGENFMMRAPKSPKRTRLLNEHGSDIVVEEDDEMARSRPPYEKTTINRIIVPARESAQDDYIEFVTNRTVTEESAVNLAPDILSRGGAWKPVTGRSSSSCRKPHRRTTLCGYSIYSLQFCSITPGLW